MVDVVVVVLVVLVLVVVVVVVAATVRWRQIIKNMNCRCLLRQC